MRKHLSAVFHDALLLWLESKHGRDAQAEEIAAEIGTFTGEYIALFQHAETRASLYSSTGYYAALQIVPAPTPDLDFDIDLDLDLDLDDVDEPETKH